MHQYLRAIGFSEYKKKRDIEKLLVRAELSANETTICQQEDETRVQLYAEVGRGIGLSLCGEMNEQDEFECEYYFPFLEGDIPSTEAPCQIQRHAEKESYAGICDEYRVGVSLIFYLQNGMEYKKRQMDPYNHSRIAHISLTALSVSGKILLPVKKTQKQAEKLKVAAQTRTQLLEEARKGSASAMDSLAMEDMELYNSISGRVKKEDLYSIVDSCFMPFGCECDQYSVIGEILETETVINEWTGETIHVMTLESSDVRFILCINDKDLFGEPLPGRRFKGNIWLQGRTVFEHI